MHSAAIAATKPTIVPAMPFSRLADDFEPDPELPEADALAEAVEFAPDAAEADELPPAVMLADSAALNVWPRVGRGTLPLTSQTPLVYGGHAGGLFEGV